MGSFHKGKAKKTVIISYGGLIVIDVFYDGTFQGFAGGTVFNKTAEGKRLTEYLATA
jgi:hypothetical protein